MDLSEALPVSLELNPWTRAIERYRNLYDLPALTRQEAVDRRLFRHCRQAGAFVVLAIANGEDEILFHRDFAAGHGWALPRTGIGPEESPEQAAVRLVKQAGLLPVEISPLAVMIHRFTCGERQADHHGLMFCIRTMVDPLASSRNAPVFVACVPGGLSSSDRELLRLAKTHLSFQKLDAPEEEVTVSRQFLWRLQAHRLLVKPLLRTGSRSIRRKVFAYLRQKEIHTAIDVASGDDPLILEIADRFHADCVANDISLATTNLLRGRARPQVVYTNHNASALPFRCVFDLAVCKNTLHHMRTEGELLGLLDSLRRTARRILLIDIEDPRRSTRLARLWNAYYTRFLGDLGGSFLIQGEFESLIGGFFQGCRIKFDTVETIKGRYLIAVVDQEASYVPVA